MNAVQITDAALIEQAEAMAKLKGVTVSKIITDTLAEAFRMENYFNARAQRADPVKALEILARAGVGNEPDEGDA
ncbi:hypothetical protein VZ95_03110 [Elstera litoralis]|uniref:CopG family transcriptional regulator n=1 Tax=Elstera litoralis TaxID=552518 RepID=A0A0F3IVC7_9PROT|nr:hypothetical protein [Elstera litoralis]KJV10695.1 hypothetical protein VZ95_03110 [Elstera litoralis]